MLSQSNLDPHVRATIISAYVEIANFFKQHCTFTEEEKFNLDGSPERVAKALHEMVFTTDEIEQKLDVILRKVFPMSDPQTERFLWPLPIIQGPILTHGICPHHFLPVMYSVTYGYSAPEGNGVLGLSKLTRIATILARRPILQEQYTKDLASILTRQVISSSHKLSGADHYVQAPLAGAIVTGTHACYSPDTEILTEYGWSRFDSLQKGKQVVQVDLNTREATLVSPISYIAHSNFSNKMLHYVSSEVDLLVTPDHRVVTEEKGGKLNVTEAQHLPEFFRVPSKINWKGGKSIEDRVFDDVTVPGLDFAKILGLFCSVKNGPKVKRQKEQQAAIVNSGIVPHITLKMAKVNLKAIHKIRKILPPTLTQEYRDYRIGKIHWSLCNTLYECVSELLDDCGTQKVPDIIKMASRPYISAFLKGYNTLSSKQKKGPLLPSNTTAFLKDLQRLEYLAGHTIYSSKISAEDTHTVPYSGTVYCVEVPTGAIVVKRNNRISICGNCMACRGVESPAATTTESMDYSAWYQTHPRYGLAASGSNITEDAQAKNLNEKLWLVHTNNLKGI